MEKKSITIEDLARMVQKGFKGTAKKMKLTNGLIELKTVSKELKS